MKKSQKVCISLILLLSFLSSPISVLATLVEETSPVEVPLESISQSKGSLEVDLDLELPILNQRETILNMSLLDDNKKKANFDISLLQNNTEKDIILNEQKVHVKIQKVNQDRQPVGENEEYRYLNIKFSELTKGNYTIQLLGNGFTKYQSESIELKEYSKRLYLSDRKGTFAIGDVNKDNKIDILDYNLVVDQIGNTQPDTLVKYDLNCDAKIDIIDLTYVAKNSKAEEKQARIENTNPILDATNISKVTTDVKTVVEGKIENLLNKSDEVVILKLKEDKVISEENPVSLSMEFNNPVEVQKVSLRPNGLTDANVPTKLEIEVETVNGEKITVPYEVNKEQAKVLKLSEENSNNVIIINLGKQVAIKKITIKIVQTKNNTNLAEIAEVEFLNNVYEEIPAPKMDIPEGLQVTVGHKQVTAKWNHATNITGYKVKITGGGKEQILETNNNTITVKELENYTEYKLRVESVNGTWESGYSQEVIAIPIPNRLPPVPENIVLTGRNLRVDANWKSMEDTQSYNIYYRKAGTTEYTKIEKVTTTNYILYGLEDKTEYEIAISGNNHLGEGAKSANYKATTIGVDPALTHNYKLINTANGFNQKTAHIENLEYPAQSATSNYDTFDVVDNDYTSYWQFNSWDAGGLNAGKPSPIIVFDTIYKMDNLVVVPADSEPYSYDMCNIRYWDAEGKVQLVKNIGMQRKTSTNGKIYYEFNFAQPVEAKKIQVNFASTQAFYSGGQKGPLTIAEMKFYYYDDLEEQVKKLFKDDLRIELNQDVTIEKIQTLVDRTNTVDEVSKEYHPNRNIILNDLEYAKKILQDKNISEITTVDQNINNGRNAHLGFSFSLNDYQPLGIVAKAGDQLAIYVGTNNTNVNLEVVFTQYYPEVGAWKQVQKNLIKGQNIIAVPQITAMDIERGGSVYIRYTSNQATNNPIKIRISGGQKIPVLDIHGITEEQELTNKMTTYLEELKSHVAGLETSYAQKGETYHEATSILNSTEIVMDDVILSMPASKILQGLTNGSSDSSVQVKRLSNTTKAFEEMMALFYKEKGLTKNSSDPKNEWTGSRIGIRYTRMFDGAFMYAAGEHIGIGLGSVAGLMTGTLAMKETNGSYTAKGYFGWGIAHEIGHVIDQSGMATAEITNNIFSLLAQTADDKTPSRLESSNKYKGIYQKVTSHTTGIPSDVFVALGMYWQLHLAYDNEPTLTATNTFYARLNTLYRNNTWGNTVDKYNTLIRFASVAAGKDLTDFFAAWGLQSNEATKTYLQEKGYEKETRPIYYLNDEARRYRLNGGTKLETTVSANLELVTQTKQTKLTFTIANGQEKLLGYEIRRNGQSVGFTTDTEYIDELNALNNRVLNYEVVAYDKLLNEVGRVSLEPVKIEQDGTIRKNTFTAISNRRNENDENEYENENIVDGSIKNILDGDIQTVFNGNTKKVTSDKTNPFIVIDLNDQLAICGLKYTASVQNETLTENTIQKYKIYVSKDNQTWDLVKTGSFNVTKENPTTQIYFDAPGSTGGNQLYTTTAGYVKIEAIGAKGISGAEIDLIAPPGDNVSIKEDNVYVLQEDYQYAEGKENIIPAGYVIFKGEYRGNPAYNAGLLIDGKGNTVENYSQLFMAQLPENATLDEIASGHWIAYMTKESYEQMLKTQKAKLQMYRVNNAETLEGQRLVSDTFYINLKEYNSLEKIKLEDENK